MCLEQEHRPRSKNTKLKNHKPRNRNTNTNPATDLLGQPNTKATNTNPTTNFSCQPNTKTTNTNPNINKNTNTNPAIHLQKTCNPSSENPTPNTNPNPNLTTTTQSPTVIGIGIRANGDGYEELVCAKSDDLRRRFPYEGANIIDGLTDQLERFLRDGSASVERSQEIHNVARTQTQTQIHNVAPVSSEARKSITDVSFFNPNPNSLHRVDRFRSLTSISMRSF